ncbi:MAG TPA: 16S rRNA (adenine(1518)-N(6)/adenine(1519)-N(6))-dimethyltransferase RsmA [Terriglobales bacterium]
MAKGSVSASSARGKKPKLGQNFLVDRSAMQKIVDALGDITQSTVMEIGPGQGALTDFIAVRAGRLIAVELDRVLSAQLRMRYARLPNVDVIEADILKTDIATIVGKRPGPLRDLRPSDPIRAKVVGNLPYYITSDILLALFAAHRNIETIVVMVQLEVGERLAAKPGGSEYGLLSATAQLYGQVEQLFKLPPDAFNPPPKVHSAVVRIKIDPQFEALQVDEKGFIDFLKLSFGQKRKTLFNNLREHYEASLVKSVLAESKVRPDTRAEALPLEKAAQIYKALRNGTPS